MKKIDELNPVIVFPSYLSFPYVRFTYLHRNIRRGVKFGGG